MFAITEEVRQRLEEVGGLNEVQIARLADAALDDELTNWPREKFMDLEGFGRTTAFASFQIIQSFKVPEARDIGRRIELPERAPYLGAGGEGYDPRDPSQFYTVPETGEMYRWDGKRTAQYPGGKRRPVIQMPHVVKDGVQIPDPDKVVETIREARRLDADWFHRGYESWVNPTGKPYSAVEPDKRAQVVRAIEATRELGYITAA
jgi:hypothetical protein